jgi:ankyrin repeat protein
MTQITHINNIATQLKKDAREGNYKKIRKTLKRKDLDLSKLDEKFDESLLKAIFDSAKLDIKQKYYILQRLISQNIDLYKLHKESNATYLDYIYDKIWATKDESYYDFIETILKAAPALQLNYPKSDLNLIGKAILHFDKRLFKLCIKYGADVNSEISHPDNNLLAETIHLKNIYFIEKLLQHPDIKIILHPSAALDLLALSKEFSQLGNYKSFRTYFSEHNEMELKESFVKAAFKSNDFHLIEHRFGKKWHKQFTSNFLENLVKEDKPLDKPCDPTIDKIDELVSFYKDQLASRDIPQKKEESPDKSAADFINKINKFLFYYKEPSSKIFKLIERNKHEAIAEMLRLSPWLNVTDQRRLTPLMFAIKKGEYAIVEMLLNAGANVNVRDKYGDTALILAIEKKQLYIASKLIKAGADVNMRDYTGSTPLMALINSFSQNLSKEDIEQYEILFEILLDNGAEIDVKNQQGDHLLLIAARKDLSGFAEYLIQHGIDINLTDNSKWTALMYAARNGGEEAVDCLIDNEADIDTKDDLGLNALTIALYNNHKNIVEKLVKSGAKIDIDETILEDIPLIRAAKLGCTELVKGLIKLGVDPDVKNDKGEAAIDLAANAEIKQALTAYRQRKHCKDNKIVGKLSTILYELDNDEKFEDNLLNLATDLNITKYVKLGPNTSKVIKEKLTELNKNGFSNIFRDFSESMFEGDTYTKNRQVDEAAKAIFSQTEKTEKYVDKITQRKAMETNIGG